MVTETDTYFSLDIICSILYFTCDVVRALYHPYNIIQLVLFCSNTVTHIGICEGVNLQHRLHSIRNGRGAM